MDVAFHKATKWQGPLLDMSAPDKRYVGWKIYRVSPLFFSFFVETSGGGQTDAHCLLSALSVGFEGGWWQVGDLCGGDMWSAAVAGATFLWDEERGSCKGNQPKN